MQSAIPTPQDDSMLVQDTTTKTASFNTPSFDFGSGFNPGGRGQPTVGVIDVSARDFTTGDETYTATLEESSDNSTFTACGVTVSITSTGVKAIDGLVNKRYGRIALVLAGTTPSITFKAWLNTAVR